MSDEKSLIQKKLESIDLYKVRKRSKPKESVIGCEHCMDYKPDGGAKRFTCPECGTSYVLANVFPGNYWEPEAKSIRLHTRAQQILDSI